MTARNHNSRVRATSRRHRRAGLLSGVFVAFIVVSGVLLNHTEYLRLDSRHVQIDALLDWYNIRPAQPPLGAKVDQHWITQVGRQVYFDDQPLNAVTHSLIGAVAINDQITLAVPDELVMLTEDGQLLETLSGVDGVPSGITLIGKTDHGRLALRAGGQVYVIHSESYKVERRKDESGIEWSRMSSPPAPLAAVLDDRYRGTGLSLERLLLDLHSGRILGRWGVAAVDLLAMFFLFSALSGLWMWARPRYNKLKVATRPTTSSPKISRRSIEPTDNDAT